MFDTMKIAAVIKQARIDRNMTQMQLADAMGVSYQAVSNWERGNSMPDISKLEDLCKALDITVEQLLGMESQTSEAVTKVMAEEELTVEELKEVAPVLPPKELKKQVKAEKKRRKLKLEAIVDLAPFLGEEELEDLLTDVDMVDVDGLEEIAPFLGKKALDRLVDRLSDDALEDIEDIACFLDSRTLDKVVARCAGLGKLGVISDLAPFLSKESLDRLVDELIAKEFDPEDMDDFPFGDVSDLYPFLSQASLKKLAKYLMDRRELEALEDLMPFV